MKKLIALSLVLAMVLTLAACGAMNSTEEVPSEDASVEESHTDEAGIDASNEGDVAGCVVINTEEDALAARDAGTLISDAYTGYEKVESTGNWHYSNYPNYKDFNADGVLKVAFVCKFADEWLTPKATSLGKTVEAAGCEYLFIDANSDEQTWMNMIENVITQDFDAVVMTPVNAAQLPEAIAMLQEAGIAYMTTDVLGTDDYGFYAPFYGWDDYYLYYELGKYVASKIAEENWMDGVAEDYSNLLFILQDSPKIDYIHLRNRAFYDGIMESCAIPEDSVLWLDCGNSGADDISAKFSSVVEDNAEKIDKWIISAGGNSAIIPTMDVFDEARVELDDVKFAGCFATDETLTLMVDDSEVAACSYGVWLDPVNSGASIGKLLIDLFNNGTPVPAFSRQDLIIIDTANVEEYYNSKNADELDHHT